MVNITDYIGKWSEKLSISEDEIKTEYAKLVEEENIIHKDLPQEEKESSALRKLALQYKRQLRSPAVGFEGMLIATGDLVDTSARTIREARKMYDENPQQAIAEGITDDEGTPLDTRKEWADGRPNRKHGKPLSEHNWLRSVHGIAVKSSVEGDSPKQFTMNLNGEVAKNESIPIFKSIKFRAIDKTALADAETLYTLNSSSFTQFEVDDSIQMPAPRDILEKNCSTLHVKITDLESHHKANIDNHNRLAIVQGDVSMIVMEPTSVGSRRLILEDGESLDLDNKGVTCWVPERLLIDFKEGSRVIVLGRTSQGKKLDEDGNQTEEPGDMMMNVFGLYAIPEYKVKLETQSEPIESAPEKAEEKSEGW